MSIVAFVESNTTGTGRLHIQAARAQGFDVVVFCSNPERYPFLNSDGVSAIVTDTSDFTVLRAAVQSMTEVQTLQGILSTSEYFAGPAARLGRDLRLPGADPDAIDQCRDKFTQRLRLRAAGIVTPRFWRLTAHRELDDVLAEIKFPCVVKPTSGTGSVGVKLCGTQEEVDGHTRLLLATDHNERGMVITPAVLVEEYIDGDEFSAEMFMGKLLGVTRKHLGAHPYFLEIGHDFPALLDTTVTSSVELDIQAALKALGLVWGHAHVEFRLVGGRPVIVEVNPRLAGGNIPKLVYLATGVDPIDLAIRAHTGQGADVHRERDEAASIRFFVLPRAGRFLTVDGISTVQKRLGVAEVEVYTKGPLDVVINGDFRDRVGHVITTGPTAEESARSADEAMRNIQVVMDSVSITGRIKTPLHPGARALLFEQTVAQQIEQDLPLMLEIDRAHVIMLAEHGIVARRKASLLLSALEDLQQDRFTPLHGRSAPRGVFLAYEGYLIDRLGAEVGGILQTGRSRNDLNATLFKVKLRKPWASTVAAVAELEHALVRQAWRHRDAVMPIYTHGQAGVPGTFGHYLAGVAHGIERDLSFVLNSSVDLRRCPLGAGAAGGSTLPLDTKRTASLLGFDAEVDHSIDAVASRDLALRLLASLSILGVTLSRLANDILQWSTAEFGFLEVPGDLAGSSSAMPQKRNPFMAEHVIGMSATPLGAFVQAASAMRSAPYSNSIQVGTEAVRPIPEAFKSIENAAFLMRLMIEGVRPNVDAMAARSAAGFTTALEWANQLVIQQGYDFRTAHGQVGEWIGRIQAGERLASSPPEPADVVRRAAYGGGPAHESLRVQVRELRKRCAASIRCLRKQQQHWQAAQRALDAAVAAYIAEL
jgi:argininosuccinate lyase